MIRQAARGLFILVATTLLITHAVGQQALDKVVIREKKDGTTKTYDGTLKFGPAGLQVVGGDGKVIVTASVNDLVKVTPGDLPGVERAKILALVTLEEKKTKADYAKARLDYAELLKATTDARSKRYLEFKGNMMAQRVADETGDDENWIAVAEPLAKAWSGFLGEYQTGWELWPAARASARLAADMGKFDEAARIWNRMTKNKELPADLKLEAGIQEVDARLRSADYAIAETTAKTLGDAAPAGAAKDRLKIYERAANAAVGGDGLAAVKDIEAIMAKTTDPTVRGTGYGAIGELYLAAKKPRDAMWAFLWVETVYSFDKEDAFKAMCRLVDVFKAQGDEDRAKAYREKIRRMRSNFAF